MKKNIYFLGLLFLPFLFSACHKDKNNPNGPSKSGTTLQLIQDSIYLYAKEDYLWYDALPDYSTFDPRSTKTGSTDIATLQNEIDKLSQYKINPATNLPYEYYTPAPGEAKYSFIDDGTVSSELNGINGDFGFAPSYNTTTDLRVKYVYAGSPADKAGIKRGYQITKINGRTGDDLDYDGDNASSPNVDFIINAYANSANITMTLLKPDGTSFDVSMTTASYTVNPVITSKLFTTTNGHKVGYIVFNSFTSDANADPVLDPVFSSFASQGVTDLVVDLRYNGGGYVSTAEHIDNLIVPSAKTNTLMYNTYYSTNLQNGKDPLLANQTRKDPSTGKDYTYADFDYSVSANATNFSKSGALNVSRVFFIMTGSTASAAELTINNLRPVLDVQFIGSTSYGKPVGFFDIDINKYQMYIPEFYTQNSANQGGYYTGFTPGDSGYPGVFDYDDLTKDFGDPTEGLLSHALYYVQNGAYQVVKTVQAQKLSRTNFSITQQNNFSKMAAARKFTGMIFNKIPNRKK